MNREFLEAAETIYSPYIKDWKEKGGKIIAYGSCYVPEEVIHAAGFLPFRLRAMEAKTTTIGDTYYGPVICSFAKCTLQLAGEGKFNFLDGAIFTHECDHYRRLYDCWRVAARDYEGILPSFFYYYGMLHKRTDYSYKWVVEETEMLIRAIEDHFGVSISEDRLRKSISLYNETRNLLKRLDRLRASGIVPISGTEATIVILAATAMLKEDFNEMLTGLIKKLEKKEDLAGSKKRLLIAGSVNDDLNFIKLFEDAGAVIVADSQCFGSRCYADDVPEEGNPVEALAKRYLGHISCPRMYGSYRERKQFIVDKVNAGNIDGVVLQNIRFCDMHGSDNGLMVRDLEKEGIPVLQLEREYGPLTETGRIRMRFDAFMERIS